MPRSVLLITSPFRPNIGGVETHLDDLILEGVKRRINFRVVTYQPLVTPARGKFIEKGRGVIIYRIPWPRFNLFLRLEKFPLLEFLYLFPGLFIAGIIYLLFKGKDISTIHGQGLVAGSIGVFLGLIFDKRSLISTHSIYNFPESGFYNSFVQSIFNKTEHILTLSNQSKDEILKLGTPKDKVTTFTYWVDQDKFKPTDKQFTRTKVKFPKNELVCLFVGRLVEVKGVRELISSSKFLIKGIKIVIIGDGPLANEIQAMARKSKKIDFFGKIGNDRLPLYYGASDVLIVPSIHEEGFGRVILEALSCGLPVIGSSRGAISEAMDESVGYFIDVSSKSIAFALNTIVKNKNELMKKAKKSRPFALRRYGSDNIEEIIKFY